MEEGNRKVIVKRRKRDFRERKEQGRREGLGAAQ